ncbi:MAG: hypothetical protein M1358_09010, partial [Chloroflexi bacterium]|nr:hypothetical protein [Chloroflexota bacterium]
TAKIRTFTLRAPKRGREALHELKERYARMLMTPREEVLKEVEQQVSPKPPTVSRTIFVGDDG